MKCRECRHGRHYANGSVNCILYGMIIRAEHECTLEREILTYDDYNSGGEGEAEIHGDGGGAAGEMPGVLPESGERGGISGMEEEQEGGGIREWTEEISGSHWPQWW